MRVIDIHQHTNYKKQLSGHSVQTHIHSILHRCTGVKIQKNHWGIIFGPKMMILQWLRRHKPYIGVCYTNDPKKGGGIRRSRLRLI